MFTVVASAKTHYSILMATIPLLLLVFIGAWTKFGKNQIEIIRKVAEICFNWVVGSG